MGHGNAEDLLDLRPELRWLAGELDVDVIGYDYHGYGLSSGFCGEQGCVQAARACLDYLLKRGVDPGSVVLVGRSLGSGPTVELAAEEPSIAGVVLQSAILSVLRTRLSDDLAH